MFQLDQPELSLMNQLALLGIDNEVVQAYYKYMVSQAVLLGANKTEAEKELNESLLFEIELAKVRQIKLCL